MLSAFETKRTSCRDCKERSCAAAVLSVSEIDLINDNRSETEFRKGDIILHEGSMTSHIIYLKSGLVKEYIKNASDKEQILQIVRGDITEETTDAIVNAANEHLQHGAGVAGAILRRGGASIQQESDAWVSRHGRVSHSQPAWTSGGKLAAKYVIHAVGPVWGDGDEDNKLSAAIKSLPIPLVAPRPIDEAISTAGGVSFDSLDGRSPMRKARRTRSS